MTDASRGGIRTIPADHHRKPRRFPTRRFSSIKAGELTRRRKAMGGEA